MKLCGRTGVSDCCLPDTSISDVSKGWKTGFDSAVWHLGGRGVWDRMDTCMWMAESLCCPLEIITILLTGYTPVQN